MEPATFKVSPDNLRSGIEPLENLPGDATYQDWEQHDQVWRDHMRKTGLQRRIDFGNRWSYRNIPNFLRSRREGYKRPNAQAVYTDMGLFEDNWTRLRREIQPHLEIVRGIYREEATNKGS